MCGAGDTLRADQLDICDLGCNGVSQLVERTPKFKGTLRVPLVKQPACCLVEEARRLVSGVDQARIALPSLLSEPLQPLLEDPITLAAALLA